MREQQNLYSSNVVLIEDKASGTQLIQELRVEGCSAVISYQPECDKVGLRAFHGCPSLDTAVGATPVRPNSKRTGVAAPNRTRLHPRRGRAIVGARRRRVFPATTERVKKWVNSESGSRCGVLRTSDF